MQFTAIGDPPPFYVPAWSPQLMSVSSPRTMPVNISFSIFGVTVVMLDGHGNVTIKVDQPYPEINP